MNENHTPSTLPDLNGKAEAVLTAIEGLPALIDAIDTKMSQAQASLEAQKMSAVAHIKTQKQHALTAIHHAQIHSAISRDDRGYSSDNPETW